jgi:hypothetical protein
MADVVSGVISRLAGELPQDVATDVNPGQSNLKAYVPAKDFELTGVAHEFRNK